LKNIRSVVVAVNYDREINKDKGPMPPFGFVTEDRINAFWSGGQAQTGYWSSFKNKIGLGPENEEVEFQKFLDTKVALLKASNPQMKDREISEEETKQAKDIFAKIEIYEKEYEDKVDANELPKEFQDKVNLQIKLQQAQFLARIYSEKMAEKVKVTDEDIDKYIAEHPELDTSAKKTKAQEILGRAKAGEDFAALANEFSEDPGNMNPETQAKNGGLYADTPKGRMVPAFEQAALALEPGQVAPDLVETDFGYHIVKLEKKGEGKDAQGNPSETYDVRHILISTGFKDPENPMAREMPVKSYVRTKLEEEKEKSVIDELVAKNHIEVPTDFTVPEVSEEQIQEMMNKQQRMPMNLPQDDEAGEAPAAKDGKGKKADTPKKK
jgi:parvulin-like peptidyl-prolyl isomerase